VTEGGEDRIVAGLRVRLDREICVGFGDCIDEAPNALRLDDEGLVVFERPEEATADDMIRAAKVCPVDAILIWDGDGNAVAP
jgi:ferredoxin